MSAAAATANLPVVGSGSLQAYIDTVHQIPILAKEEEIDLFTRLQEDDDLDAARQIIMAHLRYVVFVARSYKGYGLPLEDLIQQGNVGLMKSVRRFDLQHKVRLVSFAVYWIKAEIHEFILRNWRLVKVATTKAQRKLFFNLRKAKQRLGWCSPQEVKLIAQDLGVKPEEVVEMESRLAGVDESFDPSEEDDGLAPANYLGGAQSDNPAIILQHGETKEVQIAGLHEALEHLDERSLDIVQSRWLGEDRVGLKQLAEKYGVSLERIRQIEAKALQKMQAFIEA
jgi:RNA polymerase sigma-32 factor|tara:strand:- start:11208 stop:12056 length:849 start_codon:yes stop_codon:yes gene_type:complete